MENSWLDELGQISPNFSQISQFLAEIWQKTWLDELAT